VLQVLDAPAVRRWCAAGLEALTAARVEIDDLNVYPVPDGDTGTNLQLTMKAVAEAVDAASSDMAATAKAMAHGALMGARGNSGVILSQLLRGLAEVLAEEDSASAETLQRALIRAAELGYTAVATPVEGTVLTVAREAAASAAELGPADLASVVKAAAAGATAALARTTEQLPQLKAAGVVDAGGRGLCVLLDALELVVTGVVHPAAAPVLLVPRDRSGLALAREAGSDEFGYEVQFLLRDATDDAVVALKSALGELGDSVAIVGGDGLHNVHVHVNDVGGRRRGRRRGRHAVPDHRHALQRPDRGAATSGRGGHLVRPWRGRRDGRAWTRCAVRAGGRRRRRWRANGQPVDGGAARRRPAVWLH